MQLNLTDEAERLATAVEFEIAREARLWQGELKPVERGKMAMILAHNGGDIDQGLSGWPKDSRLDQWRAAWSGLVKGENDDDQRYDNAFRQARQVYRQGLSAEAHRHYPLRAMPALRRARDLCLPFPPFLDDWGVTIIQHSLLNFDEKCQIVCQLVEACDKVAGQRAYQRAIRGMLDGADDRQALLSALPPTINQRITNGDLSAAITASQEELCVTLGCNKIHHQVSLPRLLTPETCCSAKHH